MEFDRWKNPQRPICSSGSAYLAAGPAKHRGGSDLKVILEKLEYLPVDEAKPFETRHRIALLEAAGRFPNVFQLTAPDAPGVAFFGAEISAAGLDSVHLHQARSSASGAGLSLRQAFEGCIGEGVEYLSQFETAQDQLQEAVIEDGLAAFDPSSRKMLCEFLRPSAAGRPAKSIGSKQGSCRAVGRSHFPLICACGVLRNAARSHRRSA